MRVPGTVALALRRLPTARTVEQPVVAVDLCRWYGEVIELRRVWGWVHRQRAWDSTCASRLEREHRRVVGRIQLRRTLLMTIGCLGAEAPAMYMDSTAKHQQ